ncbi:MAG: DUF4167 domain-containing protein [Rhizobiales bacterium]|nr:DUF4167 domain-containing protein [Hyphomicrobiales bacterium]
MRPGQNKRMRGRNGRKGPNPLTRSYESNGPDVKIRGTAHHIAEKYLQLARDAHSSGDPVMAESYLQHAEHYFRLIAAAQTAQLQAQQGYQRPPGEQDADEDDDETGGVPDRFASPAERFPQQQPYQQQPFNAPQPQPQPQPQAGYGERQPYPERDQPRPQQHDRGERQDRGDRPDRGEPRADRGPMERQGQGERGPRQDRGFDRPRDNRPPRDQRFPRDRGDRGDQPRFERPAREGGLPQPFAREAAPPIAEEQPALPAFITAPVRLPAATVDEPHVEEAPATASESFGAPDDPAMEGARFPLRSRRRRRRPAQEGEAGADEAADHAPGEAPAGE